MPVCCGEGGTYLTEARAPSPLALYWRGAAVAEFAARSSASGQRDAAPPFVAHCARITDGVSFAYLIISAKFCAFLDHRKEGWNGGEAKSMLTKTLLFTAWSTGREKI
jgi:hypothetical protein